MKVYLSKSSYVFWVDKSFEIFFEDSDNFVNLKAIKISYELKNSCYEYINNKKIETKRENYIIELLEIDKIPNVEIFSLEVDIIIPNVVFFESLTGTNNPQKSFVNEINIVLKSENWTKKVVFNPEVKIDSNNYLLWNNFVSFEKINDLNQSDIIHSFQYEDNQLLGLTLSWKNILRWWMFFEDWSIKSSNVLDSNYSRLLLHSYYYDYIDNKKVSRMILVKDFFQSILPYIIFQKNDTIQTWWVRKFWKFSIFIGLVILSVLLITIYFLQFIIIVFLFIFMINVFSWKNNSFMPEEIKYYNSSNYDIQLFSKKEFFDKIYSGEDVFLFDIIKFFKILCNISEFVIVISINYTLSSADNNYLVYSNIVYKKRFTNQKYVENERLFLNKVNRDLIANSYLSDANSYCLECRWICLSTEVVFSVLSNEVFDFKERLE